jgi:hypothetical protein
MSFSSIVKHRLLAPPSQAFSSSPLLTSSSSLCRALGSWQDPTHALLEHPLVILDRAIASSAALSGISGTATTPPVAPVAPVLWAHKHNDRTCAYSEADTCIFNNKGNSTAMLLQLRRYHQEGFPKNWDGGLADTAILLRHSSSSVLQQLCDSWWNEMGATGSNVSESGSVRDQVSLPFVAWKLETPIFWFGGMIRDGSKLGIPPR